MSSGNGLKTFADNKVILTHNIKMVFCRVENMVREKEKMLVTHIFFFSRNVSKRLFPQGSQKLSLFGERLIFLESVITGL